MSSPFAGAVIQKVYLSVGQEVHCDSRHSESAEYRTEFPQKVSVIQYIESVLVLGHNPGKFPKLIVSPQ
jgi:hypothetical protein